MQLGRTKRLGGGQRRSEKKNEVLRRAARWGKCEQQRPHIDGRAWASSGKRGWRQERLEEETRRAEEEKQNEKTSQNGRGL